MREKAIIFCPVCASHLQTMTETSRFICMECHIVWHIANVIYWAARGLMPKNSPIFDTVPQEGGRT
jgi:hypothetical protein